MVETLQIRIHGDSTLPTLIYLPGLHGDWTLVSSFRAAVANRVRFVEFTYPRTLNWTLDDYAREILQALRENGITHGWLLGESFGSQIVWRILAGIESTGATRAFSSDGVILAGGFGRHPLIPAVWFVRFVLQTLPAWMVRSLLAVYGRFARFRHRHAPETFSSIKEFVQRKTQEDIKAMAWRLRLVAEHRPAEIVRNVRCPVFYLTGFVDPIVPWIFVSGSMKRNCPALREFKMILVADHNVLGTAPVAAASQILRWMGITGAPELQKLTAD